MFEQYYMLFIGKNLIIPGYKTVCFSKTKPLKKKEVDGAEQNLGQKIGNTVNIVIRMNFVRRIKEGIFGSDT